MCVICTFKSLKVLAFSYKPLLQYLIVLVLRQFEYFNLQSAKPSFYL